MINRLQTGEDRVRMRCRACSAQENPGPSETEFNF